MAEARYLESTIGKHFLQCVICSEPFTDPRALPCMHPFCCECLESWAKSCSVDNSIVSCPLCKKIHQIPEEEGIRGFPVHFLVNNLQDTVEKAKQNKSTVELCYKHGQEKKYFCTHCDCSACSDCSAIDPMHIGHSFIRLDEHSKRLSDSLKNLARRVRNVEEKYTNAIEQTQQVKQNIDRDVETTIRAIYEARNEHVRQVDSLVRAYEQTVYSKKHETERTIKQTLEKLQIDLASLSMSNKLASEMIKSSSGCDIIALYPQLSSSLRQHTESQPTPADEKLCQIKLEPLKATSTVLSSFEQLLCEKLHIHFAPSHLIQSRQHTSNESATPAVTSNTPPAYTDKVHVNESPGPIHHHLGSPDKPESSEWSMSSLFSWIRSVPMTKPSTQFKSHPKSHIIQPNIQRVAQPKTQHSTRSSTEPNKRPKPLQYNIQTNTQPSTQLGTWSSTQSKTQLSSQLGSGYRPDTWYKTHYRTQSSTEPDTQPSTHPYIQPITKQSTQNSTQSDVQFSTWTSTQSNTQPCTWPKTHLNTNAHKGTNLNTQPVYQPDTRHKTKYSTQLSAQRSIKPYTKPDTQHETPPKTQHNTEHCAKLNAQSGTKPDTAKRWKECGKFKTTPQVQYPSGIAIHSNGNIVLTSDLSSVAVFSRNGDFRHVIEGSPSNIDDIAFTPNSQCIVPSGKYGEHEFRMYDSEGCLVRSTPTFDIRNQPCKPRSVAVDSTGRIIVGLGWNNDKTVSIHQPDGTLISKCATTSSPRYITCTTDDKLIISFDNGTLQTMDQSGHNASVIHPPPGVKSWSPMYVCCSKQGELFVSNWGNPQAVYRYVCAGEDYKFIDYITKMGHPDGIALSADERELFVVDWMSSLVKIFRK